MSEHISIEDFKKVDIRVGKIIEVIEPENTHKPFYLLKIDFGSEIGIKQSLAQLTHYKKEELQGKLIAGVVNLPSLKIGSYVSEVLTLGFPDKEGKAILIVPEREVPLGGKLY